eukprot:RCo024652
MGSSKIRGVFLSAVDLLINRLGAGLDTLHKCWGRMDVQLGNVRLSYVDVRAISVTHDNMALEHHVCRLCSYFDNSLVSTNYSQLEFNTTQIVSSLLRDPWGPPTSLVIDWSPFGPTEAPVAAKLLAIPDDFRGQIVVMGFRTVQDWGTLPRIPVESIAPKLAQAFGRRVHFVELLDIVLPWYRYKEWGVGSMSLHWHQVHPWNKVTQMS